MTESKETNNRERRGELFSCKMNVGVKRLPYMIKASNAKKGYLLAVTDADTFFIGCCCNLCPTLAPGAPRSHLRPLARRTGRWWEWLPAWLHPSLLGPKSPATLIFREKCP